MPGRLEGKVALITGGARSQGRNHALTFAREGADIVVCDIAEQLPSVHYDMSGPDDLAETVKLVEALDRRCVAVQADVADTAAMSAVVDHGLEQFGHIDILLANAGIVGHAPFADITDEEWDDMIAVDLTGVFKSFRAVIPTMVEQGSGRIIVTSSIVGRTAVPGLAHYCAAKWGCIGLMKTAALELAPHGITVNAVCPTNVDTAMIQNTHMYGAFAPDLADPTRDDVYDAFVAVNAIPIPWLEMQDVSNVMLFLASDDARYITGESIHVAAGWNAPNVA
ncbi:MAG: mycofactocin-coupled SDR family oxidoreductase [Pseudonocardia sp.]